MKGGSRLFFREGFHNFCLENTEIFFYSETTIGQDFYVENKFLNTSGLFQEFGRKTSGSDGGGARTSWRGGLPPQTTTDFLP